MDNPFYNIGSGLVEIEASSVSTDTLYCDDITSISGIINLNLSTLSNINKVHCHTLSNVETYTQGNATTNNMFVKQTTTTSNITACNVSASNIIAHNISASNNVFGSNLITSNLIIYRGQNVLDTDGKIDYSWIKNAPVQNDGEGNIIITPPVIVTIFNNIINNISTGTGGDGDETYDPDLNDSNIFVHWRNVIYHPFYCRTGTDEQVAFGSNVFIEKNSKIYGVDSVDLIKTDAGRTRRLDSSLLNPVVFYDFATQECFLKTLNSSSNINASNIITSNITTNTLTSSNIITYQFTSSNVNSSNINSSNISTASFTATNSFSSNLVSSNVFSSNIVNINLWSSNISSSNVSSCNYYGVNVYASNIITSNLATSNMTSCNFSTNFITATNVAGQIGNFTDTVYVLSNIYSSNITSCNLVFLSNASWKTNANVLWQGLGGSNIAIGQSNATEKLDVIGNLKVSGGGSFASNNVIISSNISSVNALSISNINLFKNDGFVAGHFLSNLNYLTGNQAFIGTAGDVFSPSNQSSNLLVNWNSVIWKPLYQDSLLNVGFSSNVYFNKVSQLCTTEPIWDYTKSNNGIYKTFNSPFVRSNVVIDFNTLTATFCNVITSNLTVVGTTTSNVNTSNLTATVLIASNAFLSNAWASNLGINQINPLYNLDVRGTARIQSDLLVNSNIIGTCNLTIGSNIGIGTTTPAFRLDVAGTSMRLQGGAGTTPSTFFLNSTGVGATTSIIQFVNSSHRIICTDSNNYAGISNIGGGHNVYYQSIGHNFSGLALYNNGLTILSNQVLEFGRGVTKDGAAGKIGYQTYTTGSLDIVGAGTTSPNRSIKLWDDVNVSRNLTVSSNATITNNLVASNIGIGTSTPSFNLDISGFGMRLQGGASATPTIFYLNSTNAANTTSQIRFVNSGHFITCTDSNNYDGITSIGGGHNTFYKSIAHNFSGTVLTNDGIKTSSASDTIKGVKIVTQKLSDNMGNLVSEGFNITHNLNNANHECFISFRDTVNSNQDAFQGKVLAKGANTDHINVRRCDAIGWGVGPTMICMFVGL